MKIAILFTALAVSASPAIARDLSFEDRVRAQESIERVYYSHQIGAISPFEEAVPRAVLERKVRTYLDQSATLELDSRAPVTSAMLQRESERIARSTRMPERLRELYAALGNDEFLFQETVVRMSLVAGVLHEMSEAVSTGRGGAETWPSVRAVAAPSLSILNLIPANDSISASCIPDDAWADSALARMPLPRLLNSTVWTGTEVIFWGGSVELFNSVSNTGERYDPLTDSWSPTSLVNAPSARIDHTAVWTGTEMIVWGGQRLSPSVELNSGGRYDPQTDTWTATSLVVAPLERALHSAVWTSSRMIVWGGFNSFNGDLASGSQYDPVNDTWTVMSGAGVPLDRSRHSAIWTGSRMIVWGGVNANIALGGGGRYDPAANIWSPMQVVGSPSPRTASSTVWTGSRMIVWGGLDQALGVYVNDGAAYNPANNSWAPTSAAAPPTARGFHSAVWSGARMIVWGGITNAGNNPLNGSRYDPVADVWTPTSATNAPAGRAAHSAVWTGSRMIVWGGSQNTNLVNSGGRYNPLTDTWVPTSALVPVERDHHVTVWTGSEMIVWGGLGPGTAYLSSGGRYDPTLDSWLPLPSMNAPSARALATAVWSGSEMIIWGGEDASGGLTSGGRYTPATNTWSAMTQANVPAARREAGSAWTGSEMIVWGGEFGAPLNSGGRYNPGNDTWSATSQIGAPAGVVVPGLHWTGSELLVWAGALNSARYAPSTDSWAMISTTNAPATCSLSASAWTGARLVVWGGDCGSEAYTYAGGQYDPAADTWTTNMLSPIFAVGRTAAVWTGQEVLFTGGVSGLVGIGDPRLRYDPIADTWSFMSAVNAPYERVSHSAVWTGNRMLVWGGVLHLAFGGSNTGGTYDPGPSVRDNDGDGYTACTGVVHDCNDADATAFAVPGEVVAVSVSSPGSLTWASAAPGAGPGTVHDLLRGVIGEFPVGSGGGESCLVSGNPGTSAVDTSVPSPGTGFFYLVRGSNSCGSGGYGAASDGTPRVSTACP